MCYQLLRTIKQWIFHPLKAKFNYCRNVLSANQVYLLTFNKKPQITPQREWPSPIASSIHPYKRYSVLSNTFPHENQVRADCLMEQLINSIHNYMYVGLQCKLYWVSRWRNTYPGISEFKTTIFMASWQKHLWVCTQSGHGPRSSWEAHNPRWKDTAHLKPTVTVTSFCLTSIWFELHSSCLSLD